MPDSADVFRFDEEFKLTEEQVNPHPYPYPILSIAISISICCYGIPHFLSLWFEDCEFESKNTVLDFIALK